MPQCQNKFGYSWFTTHLEMNPFREVPKKEGMVQLENSRDLADLESAVSRLPQKLLESSRSIAGLEQAMN